jgi:hypothetical protein
MTPVRVKGGLLATAFVSSALATTTLAGAPSANATCFSIFGIGNGNGCTSNLTSYAVAIGDGAVADASTGFFGGVLAAGNNARATTATSAFTFASALGDNSSASAMFSLFSYLVQQGTGTTAVIGGPNLVIGASNGGGTQSTSVIGGFNALFNLGPGAATALGGTNFVLGYSGGSQAHTVGASGLGNIAMQLGPGSTQVVGGLNLAVGASPLGSGAQVTVAGLLGTIALNLLGNGQAVTQGFFGSAINLMGTSSVEMAGVLSNALNILGDGNTVAVIPGALLSMALGLVSNNVTVTAGPGPLSLSQAIFQNGVAVGEALEDAIEDASSLVNGVTSVAATALGDALAATSSGDVLGALATLAILPSSLSNALLYGFDVDGLGPADPVAGLLAANDPDCSVQCHNGGPIYQFLVGVPTAVAEAIVNITDAAQNQDSQGVDTELISGTAPDTATVATTSARLASPDETAMPLLEVASDADPDGNTGDATVEGALATDDDADGGVIADNSATDDEDTFDDATDDDGPASTGRRSATATHDTSGRSHANPPDTATQSGADAERAGKHRAPSPRHEAK